MQTTIRNARRLTKVLSGGLVALAISMITWQSASAQTFSVDQEPSEKPKTFWQAYSDGWTHLKNDEPDSAFMDFERALELNPNHTLTMVQITRALLQLEQVDEADSMSQLALASDSSSAAAHFVRGRVLQSTDRNDEAITAYKKSIELRENNPYAHNNLGLIYITKREYEDAISVLEKAVAQKDDVVYFHNNLGVSYEAVGELEKAKAAFQAALEIDPDYSKAITSMDRVKGLLGEPVNDRETEEILTTSESSLDNETVGQEMGEESVKGEVKSEVQPGYDSQKPRSERPEEDDAGLISSGQNNRDDDNGLSPAVKFAGVFILTLIIAIAFFIRNNRRAQHSF